MASVGEVKAGLHQVIQQVSDTMAAVQQAMAERAVAEEMLHRVFDGDENNGNYGLMMGFLAQVKESQETEIQILQASKEAAEAYLGILG